MSVLLADVADVVTHGSGATVDDIFGGDFSFGVWVYRTANAANLYLLEKGFSATTGVVILMDNTPSNGILRMVRGGSDGGPGIEDYITTTIVAPLNTWAYVFVAANAFGSGANIYYGTETTPLAEVTYTTQQNGTGTYGSDAAATLNIGGNGATEGAQSRLARPRVWNEKLTLAQAEVTRKLTSAQVATLYPSTCVLTSTYLDTANVGDDSGEGNNGTNSGGADAAEGTWPTMAPVYMNHRMRQG